MTKTNAAPRRTRVEQNIYKRPSGVFEVGFKDGAGVQRWRTVEGGIQAARALRDELLVQRRKGGRVSNPRVRFGEAASAWLESCSNLRPTTLAVYEGAVRLHLEPKFKNRRLDSMTPEDFVWLVGLLQAEGLSPATTSKVLSVASRVFRFSARRLGFAGANPVSLLMPNERPTVAASTARATYSPEQAAATIRAAKEPFRLLFLVMASTGARVSEALALRWQDVNLETLEEAELRFAFQLDRSRTNGQPNLIPTKTDGSSRTVPISRPLAEALAAYKLAAVSTTKDSFVFVSKRTGSVLWHRNVTRALREAQERAVDEHGRQAFPELHELDENGRSVAPARGEVPGLHSFRHSLASRLLNEGESSEEIAFLLGHANANVTRAVYIHEVADARRRSMRRDRLAAVAGSAMEAYEASSDSERLQANESNIRELRRSA